MPATTMLTEVPCRAGCYSNTLGLPTHSKTGAHNINEKPVPKALGSVCNRNTPLGVTQYERAWETRTRVRTYPLSSKRHLNSVNNVLHLAVIADQLNACFNGNVLQHVYRLDEASVGAAQRGQGVRIHLRTSR